MMVIDLEIAFQGLFKFGGRMEAGLSAEFADASVKSLDHAVCLRMSRQNETVFDRTVDASQIESVRAGRSFVPRSNSNSKSPVTYETSP